MNTAALVTDFDGTMTERDFYALVMEKCIPKGAPDDWGEYAAGRITHFEAMRRIFSYAPADEAGLEELLAAMRPDPELAGAVETLRKGRWDVIVVSAGSSWYIDRILASAGVRGVPVHANPGQVGSGLVLEMPRGSRYFSEETGVDKSAVVRDALGRYERVAFAGDGPPDLPASLLVKTEDRFARGWLARELRKRRERFREFERWSDIARALTV